MQLVSFDALRTLSFPAHTYVKPELYLRHRDQIEAADWLLFPEYWQLNPLVYAFRSRIFPSLPTYLIGHDKVMMTRVFEALVPANTPQTLIHGNTPANAERIWDAMTLPFVAKQPRASMGEGVFLIESHDDWQAYCGQAPVLYAQEYLPIDRDLRLIVIGDDVVGGYWRLRSPDGFHNNVARGGTAVAGPIPTAAAELVHSVARSLGIDHAGFDVAVVDGHPFLLEFNRLFGNGGVTELLGDLTPRMTSYLQRALGDRDPRSPERSGSSRSARRRRRAA
jgi:ribosomal protein S6--L-glutamate ligase